MMFSASNDMFWNLLYATIRLEVLVMVGRINVNGKDGVERD